jgi:DNA-binding response OmpR family regulator
VPPRAYDRVKIAIVGGDPLVGRSLVVVLQGFGYAARYLNGNFAYEPAELPEEVKLVILAPRMKTERRKAFLSNMRSSATMAGLPVLELATVLDEVRAEQEGVGLVAWPCSTEELVRRIEADLLETERTPDSGIEVGA